MLADYLHWPSRQPLGRFEERGSSCILAELSAATAFLLKMKNGHFHALDVSWGYYNLALAHVHLHEIFLMQLPRFPGVGK